MSVQRLHIPRHFFYVGLGLLLIAIMMVGTSFIKTHALHSNGPDSLNEFSNANVYYELSNTKDVNSTSMQIPIYSKTQPSSTVTIGVTCRDRSGTPIYNGSNICSAGRIQLAPGAFAADQTRYPWVYRAVITVTLPGAKGDNNYRTFKLNGPGTMLIGYSTSNSSHFAIGNINRCDSPGDTSGCGQYFQYNLPFAPACNVPTGTDALVQLYDADNGGSANKYDIQPNPFKVYIYDGGTALTQGSTASTSRYVFSGALSGNGSTASYQFKFIKGHHYKLVLKSVYANNVIQFRLPADSINTAVNCQWSTHGNSALYNTGGGSTCTSASHGSGIGATIASGASPINVCLGNNVVSDSTSTETTGNFVWGVRYTTNYGGVWNPQPKNNVNGAPVDPTTMTTRPLSSTTVGNACPWPSNPALARPQMATSPAPVSCGSSANYTNSLAPGANTNSTNRGWTTMTIPANTLPGTKFCFWVAFTPYDSNDNSNGYSKPRCFTVVAPPPVPSCSDLTDDIGDQEPNMPFTFHVTATANPALYTTPLSMTITGTGAISSSGSVSGPDASHTYTSATYTAAAGTYTARYSINGVPSPACTGTFTVAYKPFFNVIGGDVSAGAGFLDSSNNCNLDTSADIKSWNNDGTDPRGAGNTYAGAGTNLAAYALKDIAHFVTRSNATTGATGTGLSAVGQLTTNNAYDLSFANDGGVSRNNNGNYGGSFFSLPCAANYAKQYDASTASGGGAVFVPNTTTTKSYSSDVTLLGNVINSDQHVKLIVKGNVYITSDIGYNAYGSPDKAPSFALYATGNIYIGSGVHNLHGFYAAQGDGSAGSGLFATCATGLNVSFVAETTNFGICSGRLLISGAVAAQTIHFDRTFGSVNSLSPNNNPAESIIYSPELWVPTASGVACIVSAAASCPYAAISSLPPVL